MNHFDIKYYFSNNEKFWHAAPFVKILIPYCIGIVLFKCLPFKLPFTFLHVIIVITFLLSFQRKSNTYLTKKQVPINSICLFLFALFFGYLLAFRHDPYHIKNHIINDAKESEFLKGEIIRVWKSKAQHKHVFQVDLGYQNGKWVKKRGKILLQNRSNVALSVGHEYVLYNKSFPFYTPENADNIDFFNFYRNQGIFLQQYLTEDQIYQVNEPHGFSFYRLSQGLNSGIEEILKKRLDTLTFSVVNALMLGDKDYLNDDTVLKFRHGGITHILAVSGLHVGIIYFILYFLLGFFRTFQYGKFIHIAIIMVVLWAYAMITGWSISVVRAVIMFSLFLVSDLSNRKNYALNTTAFSAFCILLFNPSSIYQVSFQLSYAAVFSIILFYHRFYYLLKVSSGILDYFWKIMCVSISAQLGTFPIIIYYFHQFQPAFLVFNIIAIPYAALLLFGGFMIIMAHPIDFLAELIGKIIGFVTHIIHSILGFLLQYFTIWDYISISPTQVLILFLLVFVSTAFILRKKLSYYYFIALLIFSFTLFEFRKSIERKNKKGYEIVYRNDPHVIQYAGDNYFIENITGEETDPDVMESIKYHYLKEKYTSLPAFKNQQFKVTLNNHNKILRVFDPQLKIPGEMKFEVIILDFLPSQSQKKYFNRFTKNLLINE